MHRFWGLNKSNYKDTLNHHLTAPSLPLPLGREVKSNGDKKELLKISPGLVICMIRALYTNMFTGICQTKNNISSVMIFSSSLVSVITTHNQKLQTSGSK